MTDPPLLRPDEAGDDLTRNQNRELARRQAYADLGAGNRGDGGVGLVLLVMPWLLVVASVFVLAVWFSGHTTSIRDLLEATPLERRLATAPDAPDGEPGVVAGVVGVVVFASAVVVTMVRGAFWRRWFREGGRVRTLRIVLWALTLARSTVIVIGAALAGVAGGVARGVDLDPAFRPTDVAGWWPWLVVAVSCVWISFGSVRRTTNKVARRIEGAMATGSAA